MKKKQQNYTKGTRRLVNLLLLSSVLLVGTMAYAYNRERISNIDWNALTHTTGQKLQKVWKQIKPKPDIIMNECSIYIMTDTMPVLTHTPDKNTSLIDVPRVSQAASGMQTGCELVSADMLLQYYGIQTTAQELYNVMPHSDVQYVDGQLYGGDPNDTFIGDPTSMSGYGCYAPALTNAMNAILNQQYYAVNITGTSLEQICSERIDKGIPVIIWATINMMEPSNGKMWKNKETGQQFQWLAGEHCLVLVGYDDTYYYFNNPDDSQETIGYERALVEKRYEQLGKQAIIISK